tara:strand:- start:2893 stop:3651 length:759 start_codon:yes stop_codon:yes gene_type:complete
MTAINIIRQRYRVSILTDGAGYSPDGTLRGHLIKCMPIPHLRAAVATRGSGLLTALFASNFGYAATDFDHLVSIGGALAEQLYDQNFAAISGSTETELELYLGGWSESNNRPEAYVLCSDDRHGFEKWELHPIPEDVTAAPVPSGDDLLSAGFDLGMDPADFDPVRHGLMLMEVQRRMKLPPSPYGNDCHIVGGFACLTEITKDGIGQRIIRKWRDKIGEPINPFAATEDQIIPMNRQQRRAVERAQSKRTA